MILGAPFDGGTSHRPGARFGPMAIRMTDYLAHDGSRPSLALRTDGLVDLGVVDAGDVEMYSGDIEVALPALEAAVEKVARAGAIPVVLGGDHSIAYPDAKGVANVLGHGRVSMLHFDAHADTGDIEFGSLWGHGQPMRRLIESGALRGDRFLQIGLRGYWPPPDTLDWMAAQRMRSYEMTEIGHRGLDVCLTEAFATATDECEGVFLSVDIDVCDPGHAPGTGTPEPGGLSARQLLDAVRRICLELPGRGDRRRRGQPAVRPRRHHRGPGQPGRAGGAVRDRPPAPGRPGRTPRGTRPGRCWTGAEMHRVDQTTEQMVRSVLAYAENRLRMDPVPLDQGTLPAAELYERLGGVIRDSARHPDEVLGVYASVIAPERDLGRQPAVPRLHPGGADQGQPAVRHARLLRLDPGHLLAGGVRRDRRREHRAPADRRRGRAARDGRRLLRVRWVRRQPVGAGGRAGDGEGAARRRRRPRRRLRVVVGTDAHSSIVNTLRLLEMDALVVETPDHRLTRRRGARPPSPTIPTSPTSRPSCARPAPPTPASSTTSPASGALARRARLVVPRRRRVRRLRASSRRSLRPKYDGLELADSFILDPHKWLFTPFDCCALIYREPGAGPGDAHPGRVVPRRHPRLRRRVEPDRLRLPPDPAGSRAAAVVLAGRQRRRRLPRGHRGRRSLARTRPTLIRPTPHLELIREPDLGVVLFRAPAGGRRLRRLGRRRCTTTASRSSRRASGRARPSDGSPSCTPTRRWTWCARSSTARV